MIFRAIGAQLAKQGYSEAEEDIFYLTKEEILNWLRQPHSVSDPIAERRAKLAGDRTYQTSAAMFSWVKYLRSLCDFSGQARSQLSRQNTFKGLVARLVLVKGQVLVVDDVQPLNLFAQGKIMVIQNDRSRVGPSL